MRQRLHLHLNIVYPVCIFAFATHQLAAPVGAVTVHSALKGNVNMLFSIITIVFLNDCVAPSQRLVFAEWLKKRLDFVERSCFIMRR